MSHTHAATFPPGRVTRFISPTAAIGSETKWNTSWASVRSKELVLEGERLRRREPDIGAGDVRAALLDERLGRVDRGNVVGADDAGEDGRQRTGAAADVEHALPGCDTGGAGELGCEHPAVAPHEAVVGVGVREEVRGRRGHRAC